MADEPKNEWRVQQLTLPKNIREGFYEQLYRLSVLYGCPISKDPSNEFSPSMVTVIERLSHILAESPDEVLK
jgi:hypothetical protein